MKKLMVVKALIFSSMVFGQTSQSIGGKRPEGKNEPEVKVRFEIAGPNIFAYAKVEKNEHSFLNVPNALVIETIRSAKGQKPITENIILSLKDAHTVEDCLDIIKQVKSSAPQKAFIFTALKPQELEGSKVFRAASCIRK